MKTAIGMMLGLFCLLAAVQPAQAQSRNPWAKDDAPARVESVPAEVIAIDPEPERPSPPRVGITFMVFAVVATMGLAWRFISFGDPFPDQRRTSRWDDPDLDMSKRLKSLSLEERVAVKLGDLRDAEALAYDQARVRGDIPSSERPWDEGSGRPRI